ncbi:hypothetical protein M0R45_015306 [Rubus argutus]|uniref:F-box protein n=1 Tax=Rubus argutus TaxID=59490 RepID=A0AAW1XP47_RUBAR
MAALQASFCSSSFSSASSRKIKAQRFESSHLPVHRLLVNELSQRNGLLNLTATSSDIELNPKFEISKRSKRGDSISDSNLVQELYAVMEIVADRIEMHNNIKAQRDNWNGLLLNSVNGMTATAAIMAGLACVTGSGPSILSLKISSSLLYMAVTGIVLVMNKIQPSQLAEEQRNASRLFKKLHEEIKTTLALKSQITSYDVKVAMEKVLALDKAYPLPLLGTMIEKFPQIVEPAVWWPEEEPKCHHQNMSDKFERNGWNEKLEEEMKEVLGVMKGKDSAEYARLSNMVLKVNKILAFCGPLLTGSAAIGSGLIGLPGFGSWGAVLGVVVGALGSVVNTLEHGGQVGMVFEMYRSSAGFFKLMEETIESTLKERKVGDRENGELFEVKVALQLGRSLSELRDLANASSVSSRFQQAKEEFASKLF